MRVGAGVVQRWGGGACAALLRLSALPLETISVTIKHPGT
jgi:hypothetical protein